VNLNSTDELGFDDMRVPKADDSPAIFCTPCSICQNLEPPWPIKIYFDELNMSKYSSCKGCELLRVVLEPHASELQDTRYSRELVTVKCMNGKMFVEIWSYKLFIYAGEGMFS
jgi:Pyruvate/2-oxoacid:ferredoxin oxidoreductase delta subunit